MGIKAQLISLIIFILFTGSKSTAQVSDSLFNMACLNENLIILDEEMEVNITGRKITLMIATVTKKQTVVIAKSNGLTEFQNFKLPRRFDELYIYHAPAIRNINWSYDNARILSFDAKLKNNHADKRNLNIAQNSISKRVIDINGYFGDVDEYEYSIENLVLGDTLELSYSYEIPFVDNWIYLLSNRLFFHGKYPKKYVAVTWCYNIDLVVDSLFENLSIPEVTIDGNKLCYHWNFQNLPGCLDEPGSRPYETLPHLIFVPKSYDLEYTHFNSYVQEFVPIYFFESNDIQSKLYTEVWDNVIGTKNKNNSAYKKVADRYIAMAPDDTVGLTRMRYFQQFMVDSVTYDPAINYYSYNENQLKQRAGVDLKARIVKDNNLERIYGNIVPRFDLDIFTAYPVDGRVGQISPQYNPTIKDNDLLFGIALKDNNLGFVIPRSDKNYYYFEEVPFYYEDIPVLLLHFLDFPNQLEKRNFNTDFRKIYTPTSGFKDNYRKIQSKVSVDLENNLAEFQTRIVLSGQYSTLTRNVYSSYPVDSTVNPRYQDPIWNISDNVKVSEYKQEHPNIYYPFKTTINARYEQSELIHTDNSQYILEPGNWFKLIYWDDILVNTRFLDYYPDFVGSDSYSYMLEFDNPVKLVSDNSDVEISNQYGHFSFVVKQMSEKNILLNCNYNIFSRKVDKDSIGLVKEINQAIIDLQESEFIIETVE